MAFEYLADSADSLAAGSWKLADGTAGTGPADGATLKIDRGAQTIDQDTDLSAYDFESFDIEAGFSGKLGTNASPLKIKASYTSESDTNLTSRVRYWASGGECYLYNTSLIDYLQVNTGGFINLLSGDFKHLHLDNGRAYFNSTATCGASGVWEVSGGYLFLDQHASDLFVTLNINGSGQTPHQIKRGGATLNVRGGNVIFDGKNSSVTTVNLDGGTLDLRSHNGTGPTLNARGGILNLSRVSRPITFSGALLGNVQIVGYNKSLVTFSSPKIVGKGPTGLSGV